MRRVFTIVGLAAVWSLTAFAQSSTKPAFDLADVHVRPRSSNPNPQMSGGVLRSGRYDLRNATMLDMIATAYNVNVEAVIGGPNWLGRDRFDVVAKAPQTTSQENVRLMLQDLLAQRFGLAAQKDNRELPGVALTVASGKHKMKEGGGGGGTCEPKPQTPEPGTIPYQVASCRNVTMDSFAEQIRFMAGAYVERPVTNLTGLTGGFDFEFKWTGRAQLAQAGADGISYPDALEKQLGLKLEPKAISQPVLVVTSVNQRPTASPSNAASLPSGPPAEFDVADIKLNEPGDTTPSMGRLQPGGRLNFTNIPLVGLISLAWDIADPSLLAAPDWLEPVRVSVVARVSDAALGGSADGMQIDIDDVRLMLQALLKERFAMTVHVENRPVNAYTLLIDEKAKLAKADPANRTNCRNGAAPNARDPRNSNPILSRLVTCQNITMAEFAEDLPRIAPGYLRTPVTDETGIQGNWDFTFNFSPVGVGQPGGGTGVRDGGAPAAGGPPPSAPLTASDPSGAITLFEALKRQLGLKLEMQKRPLPVLVIDKMERRPIEN